MYLNPNDVRSRSGKSGGHEVKAKCLTPGDPADGAIPSALKSAIGPSRSKKVNCGKSAEAIVGRNPEGLNVIIVIPLEYKLLQLRRKNTTRVES